MTSGFRLRILVLAALVACEPSVAPPSGAAPPGPGAEASEVPTPTTPPASPSSPGVATPTQSCPPVRGLPAPWVPATLDDYVPAARALVAEAPELACPTLAGDYDQDGKGDVVALAVDPTTGRSALFLVPADGAPRAMVERPPPPAGMTGHVYTPIADKPAGERVLRDSLADRDRLTAPAAVEMCRAVEGAALTIETVCYCSTWYWVAKGTVQTASACD